MIEWNDSLLIGVEAIDLQHKSLFEQLKNIERELASGNGQHITKAIVAFMDTYVVEHFGLEEDLMHSIGYPGLASHKQDHLQFIDKSIEFELDKYVGDPNLPKNMLAFFSEWFVRHISGADMEIAAYIKENS